MNLEILFDYFRVKSKEVWLVNMSWVLGQLMHVVTFSWALTQWMMTNEQDSSRPWLHMTQVTTSYNVIFLYSTSTSPASLHSLDKNMKQNCVFSFQFRCSILLLIEMITNNQIAIIHTELDNKIPAFVRQHKANAGRFLLRLYFIII